MDDGSVNGRNKQNLQRIIFNILEGTEWGKQQDTFMISKMGEWSSDSFIKSVCIHLLLQLFMSNT